MSKSIDERIVSMQFDNKQFEAGTKQTMNTLDKLKKALKMDGAAKGLDDVSKAAAKVSFHPLTEGLETVKLKFSASYALAERYFNKMMDWVERLGKKMVNELSIDQISAGWSKYTQKTSSVQTIMNATGKSIDEVNSVLEKLMWFSDETSYAFTDMTSSLAQLASSGANVDKIIPMITGIANATAYAGKGSSEFSRAIYNLNQSYGAGYLQLMDWKSLELAGVASKQLKQELISAAEALGKIKKGEITIENFSSSLSKKWATTEVMEKAFGKFSEFSDAVYNLVQTDGSIDTAADAIEKLAGKYDSVAEAAFKSAQEAKSFQEAIDATKDAVSSGWMTTFEMIFGNYQESKVFWTELTNTLWDVFASGAEARNELLRLGLDNNYQKLSYNLSKSGTSIEQFEAKVANLLTSDYVNELVTEFGSLGKAIRAGVIPTVFLEQALDDLADSANNLSLVDTILGRGRGKSGDQVKYVQEALKELGYNLGTFGDQGVDGIFGKYTEEAVKAFQQAKGLTVDGIVGPKTLHALTEATLKTEIFGEEITDLVNNITQKGGRELLFESFQNIVAGVTSIVTPIKTAFRDIFPATTSEQLYNFIVRIRDFTAGLEVSEETANKIHTIFTGIFSIVRSVWKIIKSAFSGLWDGIKTIFPNIENLGTILLDFAASIGTKLTEASKWLDENFNIKDTIKNLVVWIRDAIAAVKDWVVEIYNSEKVQTVLTKISGWFESTFGGVGEFVSEAWESIKQFFKDISFEGVSVAFSKFGKQMSDAFGSLANSPFMEKIKGYIQTIKNFFIDVYESIFGSDKNSVKNAIRTGSKFGFDNGAITSKPDYLEKEAESKMWRPLELLIDGCKRIYNFIIDNPVLSGLAIGLAGALALVIKIVSYFKYVAVALRGAGMMFESASNAFNALADKIRGDMTSNEEHNKSVRILSWAAMIAAIAGAIIAMEYGIKELGSLDDRTIIQGLGAVSIIMFAMYELVKHIDKLGDKTNYSAAVVIASMSISLLLMSKVIKIFGSMVNDDFWTLVKGTAVVAVFFIGLIQVLKRIGSSGRGGTSLSAAAELISMAIVIRILVGAVKEFGEMDRTTLIQGGIAVAALMTVMGGIVALIDWLTNKGGNSSGKGAFRTIATILSLAVSMKILVGAVKQMGSMDVGTLIKGGLTIGALIVFMGYAAKLSTTSAAAGGKIKTASFVSMALAIVAVAAAIKILEDVNTTSIVTAGAAIAGVVGVIAYLSKASAGVKSSVQIAFIAGLVLAIAYAITSINELSDEQIKNASDTITNILYAIGIVSRFAASFGGNLKVTIAGIVGVAAIIATIGGALYFVMNKLPAVGKSVAKFILALVDPEVIAGLKGLDLTSGSGLAGMIALLREFGMFAKDLAIANFLSLGKIETQMTEFIDALNDLQEPIQSLISNVPNVNPTKMRGVESFMKVIGRLGEIANTYAPKINISGSFNLMKGMGWMGNGTVTIPMLGQLSDFMSEAGPLITSLCDVVKTLDVDQSRIDNILPVVDVIGRLSDIASSAPAIKVTAAGAKIGKNIKAVIAAVEVPTLWALDDFISNAISPITSLITAIKESGIEGEFDSSKFETILSGVAALVSATGDGASIKVIAAAGGGKWGGFGAVGVAVPMIQSMVDFVTAVAPVVVSMTEGLSKIDGMDSIDGEALNSVMSAVKVIAESAKYAPDKETAVAAAMIGPLIMGGTYVSEPQLEAFGKFINDVGTGCVGIFRELAGIEMPKNMEAKAGVFEMICTNVKILAESAKYAPTKTVAHRAASISESIASDDYTTSSDLVALATFITDVAKNAGETFMNLSENLKTTPIDEKGVTNICKSVRTLASAAAFLPQEKIENSWFSDTETSTDYANFVKFIADVGTSISSLASATIGTTIDTKRIQSIAITIKTLAQAAAEMPSEDFALINDDDGPAAQLKNFAVSMGGAISEVATLTDTIMNTSGVLDIAEVIKTLAEALLIIDTAIDTTTAYFSTGNTGENEVEAFVRSTVNMLTNLDESIADMDLSHVGEFVSIVADLGQAMFNMFNTDFESIDVISLQTKLDEILLMFEHFGADITDNTEVDASNQLFTSVSNAINSALTAVRTEKYENFKNAGTYLMSGLNTGIVNGFGEVFESVRAGASRVVTIAKQIFKIASPSKVFKEIGMYNMMGLARGTDEYAGLAIDSARKVSENYIQSMSNGPMSIASMISSGFEDNQPVIKPIVDLSDVHRGADAISSMFGNSDLTVRSVNAISSNLAYSKSRSVGNDAIVSAIGDLKDGIINTDRNTYSINGITYDDGSNIASAIKTLVDAVVVEGRV